MSAVNTSCKNLVFRTKPSVFVRWPTLRISPFDREFNSAYYSSGFRLNTGIWANVSKDYSNPLLTFLTWAELSFVALGGGVADRYWRFHHILFWWGVFEWWMFSVVVRWLHWRQLTKEFDLIRSNDGLSCCCCRWSICGGWLGGVEPLLLDCMVVPLLAQKVNNPVVSEYINVFFFRYMVNNGIQYSVAYMLVL